MNMREPYKHKYVRIETRGKRDSPRLQTHRNCNVRFQSSYLGIVDTGYYSVVILL